MDFLSGKGQSNEEHHYRNLINNHLLHSVLRDQNVVRYASFRSLRLVDYLRN